MKKYTRLLLAGLILLAALVLAACEELHYIDKETTEAPGSEEFNIYALDIPDYSGSPTVAINDDTPFFASAELTEEFYIELAELDVYGRCGSCMMCADEPHIQEGERESLYDIEPSGWHGRSIYQRSHLLMWKLGGPDEERNLITGTETFNQEAMLEYEERVTAYLWRNPSNHVIYRVTPLFKDRELVARGVLMEAYSVEDAGRLKFCVFVYNVEPGYQINYSDGTVTAE
ncbi:MAG: DNA/RNA non-specific endonuclease [Lachnospiraceae bacterium]|nr:DNA/RNA non-specific endonuclease [Lachnospiraceae bacterium]